ncbi:helix-turn-helix domain-containing protein [Bosea sp. 2RAB26]|uniref:helix-turn-helix domain-containing protein n=1 Tax=Bosea sp. 2RAB26 TaxID=3237476 RepID=UPI003F90DB41
MSILKVSIPQIKAARALLEWSQATMAERCGVSLPTIKRLEAAEGGALGGRTETAVKIIDAIQAAGIEFVSDGRGDGVMKLKSRA